jgi:hypothetical protein
MKPTWLYRITAILLLLFAVLHTLGFRQNVPEWGAASVIASMQSTHFNAQGFQRTYWDFFSAFGLFFSVFLLSAAAQAWQLSRIPPGAFSPFMRQTAWTLALTFIAITALNWAFAFPLPIAFSTLTTALLVAAASLSK